LEAALRDVAAVRSDVRADAVRDLAHHAADARAQVVGALQKALSDEAGEVRSAAAVALADIGGIEALPSLLFAVEDEDSHVRQMALSAVGELGDSRAKERLVRALTDERPEVRFQAIIAFSRIAPDEAMDALAEAFADSDPNIRYIAVRCAEERALGTDPPALLPLERMRQLLGDADAAVRVAAAIVLARSGDRAGLPLLLEVVRSSLRTREAEDEAAAIELVGELGAEEAKPYLERRAFGFLGFGEDRFAWQAMVSLARMGHPRARARIVRDLGARSRDRRTLAVAAAGRALLHEARPLIEAMRGDERRADATAVDTALDTLRGPAP